MQVTVKIPKNSSSRLSEDVWLIGEALSRHYRTSNLRVAIESAIRITADRLASEDPNFAKLLNDVRKEGVEDSGDI
jgi:hypothetical protein